MAIPGLSCGVPAPPVRFSYAPHPGVPLVVWQEQSREVPDMAKTDTGQLLREVRNLIGHGDPDGLPDGQLLARFVDERDESAFEVLVRRYGRLVFGVCRKVTGDAHTAEDAFQATFLVLVHKAASLDRRRPVADWLYTVAFRLA